MAMERLEVMRKNQRRIERLLVEQMSDGVLMTDTEGNPLGSVTTLLDVTRERELQKVGAAHCPADCGGAWGENLGGERIR